MGIDEAFSPAPLLQDFLRESAQRNADRVALVTSEVRRTYADLEARSNALAHALKRRGVARGDRVVVFTPNQEEALVSFWGALKADSVPVMVNPQTRASKLAFLLRDCRPAAVLAESRLKRVAVEAGSMPALVWGGEEETFESAIREESTVRPPERKNIDVDLAAIIYTSGSTGESKGVMLTHRAMRAAAESISAYLGLRGDDVILCVLPLSFDYGLYQAILAARMGARLVLERSFSYPAGTMAVIAEEGVTVLPAVPTVLTVLGSFRDPAAAGTGSVRLVTNTAEALAPSHIASAKRVFPHAAVCSMYGLTECKRVSYLPPEDLDRKPSSVGLPIPNTEFWVVDAEGRRLAPGEVGQLVVRGATIMAGYWERPEETEERLRPGPLPGERVLFTGDLARIDEEGYLYFVGRTDDIIKSRGEKVAPREVEQVLMAVDGVREAAVIGVPDETLGRAVKAFVAVEPGSGLTEAMILRHCRERLEGYMVPKFVEIRADLPRTSSGKIRKSELGGTRECVE